MASADAELLQHAAEKGGGEALSRLFDRYVGDIYDFSIRLLGDQNLAAATTREAFRQSIERFDSLSDPSRFRADLFANALAFVLERRPDATTPSSGEALYQIQPETIPAEQREKALAAAPVIWERLTRLEIRDLALLDLHVRHGLEPSELAIVFGTSLRKVSVRLRHLEAELQADLLALAFASRQAEHCDSLKEVLLSLPVAASLQQLRKAAGPHVRDCSDCSSTLDTLPPPLTVYAAFAPVPLPEVVRVTLQREFSIVVMPADIALPATALGSPLPPPPTPPPPPLPPAAAYPPPPPPPLIPSAEANGGGLEQRLAAMGGFLRNSWHRFVEAHTPIIPFSAAIIVLATAGGIAWCTGVFGGSDGSGGAVAVETATPKPTVTPQPTSTPSPTVIPSPTTEPSSTPEPFPPTEEPTLEPTATLEPATPTPDMTPTIDLTAAPTGSATPDVTKTPSGAPPETTPTETPIP